jgi:hypothetical protein
MRWCVLVALLLSAAASVAQPGYSVVPCLEVSVLRSDTVVVGTLEQIEGAQPMRVVVTVQETLKGARTEHLHGIPSVALSDAERLMVDRVPLLVSVFDVAGVLDITPLPDVGLAVPRADFTVLTKRDDVLAAARAIATAPSSTVSFNIRPPWSTEAWRMWSQFAEERDLLAVPIGPHLGRWVRDQIERRSDEIYTAFEAIRHFRTPDNEALLRRLLEDDKLQYVHRSDLPLGNVLRRFPFRKAAYDVLTGWGVDVPEPFWTEEVSRIEEMNEYSFPIELATVENIRRFKVARRLWNLGVQLSRLGDAEMAAIAEIQSVTRIFLYRTETGDEPMRRLVGMDRLRELSLNDTGLTDAGLMILADIKTLERIHLQNQRVTAQGLAAFRARRPDVVLEL